MLVLSGVCFLWGGWLLAAELLVFLWRSGWLFGSGAAGLIIALMEVPGHRQEFQK